MKRPHGDPIFEYSFTSDDLQKNSEVITRLQEHRQIELHSATWFVPYFDHIYRGGIYTIMRFANYFSERSGTLNRFVFYGSPTRLLKTMEEDIRTAFPHMNLEVLALEEGMREDSLPDGDIGICTYWSSAYHLLRYNRCKGKFYFVQDFEPAFYAAGSMYGIIETTYRFGFEGIVNTPGVCECYRRYAPRAEYFIPAVDHGIFFPAPSRSESPPLRVVFYARPSKPRNGLELGLNALRTIKSRFKGRIEIFCVGENFDASEYGFQDVVTNMGTLSSLRQVADLYRTCHVGLVFMFTKHPSYQPLEYMACGCATVTNYNDANGWLFKDGDNAFLAHPTVDSVAETLMNVIEDGAMRKKVITGGLSTVRRLHWEFALERIYRYITDGRSEGAASAAVLEADFVPPDSRDSCRMFDAISGHESHGSTALSVEDQMMREVIAEKSRQLTKKDDEIAGLRILLEQKTRELRQTLVNFQESLSWRITAPLRFVHSRLFGIGDERRQHEGPLKRTISDRGDVRPAAAQLGESGTESEQEIVDRFHRLYYNAKARTWGNTYWLGKSTMKCPLDFWIYQEIVYDIRPEVIIECGTYKGGSALFLAAMCDLIAEGTVVTIDVQDWGERPSHKRIKYLLGSSTSEEILREVKLLTKGKERVMVLLDSDHSKEHVLNELRIYSQFVTKGSYLVLEDTNINGHPARPDFGPGPMEALTEFLKETNDFVVDEEKEKFYLTFNPKGYLRKVKG